MLSAIRRAPSSSPPFVLARGGRGLGGGVAQDLAGSRAGDLRRSLEDGRSGRRRLPGPGTTRSAAGTGLGLELGPGHDRVLDRGQVALEQLQVGVQAVRAGPERLDQRVQLVLHRVDPLEHPRRRLRHPADVLPGLGGGVLAGGSASVLASARISRASSSAWRWMSAALVSAASTIDRTCSRGGRGERLGAPAGRALELVDLLGERVQMGVNRVRVVAPPPDGEVLLLDALSIQRHELPPSRGGEATGAYRTGRGGLHAESAAARLRRPPDRAGA